MATYLIGNAVTWIGLTQFHSGDALIVTPSGALVMPDADLSDLDAGGPTTISFAGYVALNSLSVDADVTFGITQTGQVVSSSTQAALRLVGAHLDTAGQITAAKGTAVELGFTTASLMNAGRLAGFVGAKAGGTGAEVQNSGQIEGSSTAVLVTGTEASLRNAGAISGPEAIKITSSGSFTLFNTGAIHGDILSTGDSRDTVRNSGTISGDLDLGAGNDRFSGGHLLGDLDMGTGNDWVDARFHTVSGKISDTGGADTYLIDTAVTQIRDTGSGRDTVVAWCSYTLPSGIENLTLRGNDSSSGTGNARANTMIGNNAQNHLVGGDGADRMFGGGGNDNLYGGNDADRLFGGADQDFLFGGNGADVLNAGAGADGMHGGGGADRFVFSSLSDMTSEANDSDVIDDFEQGADTIDLSAMDANSTNGSATDSFAFIGNAAFTHEAGQLRFEKFSYYTLIQLDVTGDGVADGLLYLSNLFDLTATDFIL